MPAYSAPERRQYYKPFKTLGTGEVLFGSETALVTCSGYWHGYRRVWVRCGGLLGFAALGEIIGKSLLRLTDGEA